jgi:hypothetical protein
MRMAAAQGGDRRYSLHDRFAFDSAVCSAFFRRLFLSRLLARVQHADVIEACKISGFLQQQVKLLRLVLINEFSFSLCVCESARNFTRVLD